VSISLLGWLAIETQGGSVLGLAERLTSSIQITWPFIVALALRPRRPSTPAGPAPRAAAAHHDQSGAPATRTMITGRNQIAAAQRSMPSDGWVAALDTGRRKHAAG
jgi:hypothetical protein